MEDTNQEINSEEIEIQPFYTVLMVQTVHCDPPFEEGHLYCLPVRKALGMLEAGVAGIWTDEDQQAWEEDDPMASFEEVNPPTMEFTFFQTIPMNDTIYHIGDTYEFPFHVAQAMEKAALGYYWGQTFNSYWEDKEDPIEEIEEQEDR